MTGGLQQFLGLSDAGVPRFAACVVACLLAIFIAGPEVVRAIRRSRK